MTFSTALAARTAGTTDRASTVSNSVWKVSFLPYRSRLCASTMRVPIAAAGPLATMPIDRTSRPRT
jgi:hypothetical protein